MINAKCTVVGLWHSRLSCCLQYQHSLGCQFEPCLLHISSSTLLSAWERSWGEPKCLGPWHITERLSLEFQAPGLGPAQLWQLWPFWKWTSGWKTSVSPSLPVSLSNKQGDTKRERRRSSIRWFTPRSRPGQGQKPGPQDSMRISQVGGRDPNPQVNLCCLPRPVSKVSDQKQSCKDSKISDVTWNASVTGSSLVRSATILSHTSPPSIFF